MPATRTRLLTLKAAIVLTGQRQCDFAVDAGIAPATLTAIIMGRIQPWPRFVVRCCELLGADEAELFPEVFNPASPSRDRVRGVA